MIVLPRFAIEERSWITWRAVVESRPVVGSSKQIMFGFVMSQIPIDVRFRSPPETPLMNVLPILTLQQSLRPSYWMSSSTRSDFQNYVISSFKSAANWKHYFGVNVPNKASSCITQPIWLEKAYKFLIMTPLILNSPSSIRLSDMSRPAKKLRNVVFPEPEGPRIAVKDEAGITPF